MPAALSTSSSVSELSKVQLAHLDIDPDTLAGDGPGLWELIGTDRSLDVRAAREQLGVLPPTGWRRVHSRDAGATSGRAEMLAAPYPQSPNRWAVVNLAERDGKWLLSTDPGPLSVFPGRAQRRQSLRLSWPNGPSAPAGTVPDLHVVLTNVSTHQWINDTGESAYIRAWLLDDDGHRIETSSSFVFTQGETTTLPDLDANQSCTLPVVLATPDLDTYPPGSYVLDAMLVQLNLRTQHGILTLT